MDSLFELEKKIEAKRDELNHAGNMYELRSEFILRLSGELDELLITYQILIAC
ncbi:aspartyl-phosphate phosphatase Spo0E family protein [Paenibacillus frigoriresistens]|uniref:aspartyl-phosphate phosphatase Spo0E family protein n=1 Tax=Paenibacillus alginolyticus TaxID=59839 RepID=UPI0015661117|nr:aspartyl-phosphate phosphatase Spo0E family protein [Paenibacillus frigoriresistens]NRF93001.1 aspartyl-phosphate phosphatase Spo0E family protein [Paenibacillus frigoriresistens]